MRQVGMKIMLLNMLLTFIRLTPNQLHNYIIVYASVSENQFGQIERFEQIGDSVIFANT